MFKTKYVLFDSEKNVNTSYRCVFSVLSNFPRKQLIISRIIWNEKNSNQGFFLPCFLNVALFQRFKWRGITIAFIVYLYLFILFRKFGILYVAKRSFYPLELCTNPMQTRLVTIAWSTTSIVFFRYFYRNKSSRTFYLW